MLAGCAAQVVEPGGHPAPRITTPPIALAAGEIHVFPTDFALFWSLPDGRAIRYFVGVSSQDQWRPGTYTVNRKAERPRWTPTAGMIRREPEIYRPFAAGIPGDHPRNPLGARALYLYRGGRDTYLRIHGSPPNVNVVGATVSNGCIQMTNEDAIDLYNRVPTGTRVVLHP